MRRRRPFPARAVGGVALVVLVAVNIGLLLLNASSRGWLPGGESDSDGDGPGSVAQAESDGAVAAAPGSTGSPTAAGGENDDPWPGGRGPVPDGPPLVRRVLIGVDGQVTVVGSAPRWVVVEELTGVVARSLGRDPSTVAADVTWHPDASAEASSVDVELVPELRYGDGALEPIDGGELVVELARGLLAEDPARYVVVVGDVPAEAGVGAGVGVAVDSGRDEDGAVALARVTALADDLVAAGVDPGRVVTVVAPIGGPEPDAEAPADGPGRVILRIGNLLAAVPAGA